MLVVDQAEQLVTDSAGVRAALLDRIAEALEERGALRVIATLREEYLSRVLGGTRLDGRATVTFPLGPLSPELLAEVIEKPAARAGVDFEPGLVQRMVVETVSGVPSGGDPLPLLAYTLDRLFVERGDSDSHHTAHYDAVGGVTGALRTEADRGLQAARRSVSGLGDRRRTARARAQRGRRGAADRTHGACATTSTPRSGRSSRRSSTPAC